MTEPDVEGFIPTGDAPAPAWYLFLRIKGMTEAQVELVRDQAQVAVDRYADSQRAIILNTFRSIVTGCENRLGHVIYRGLPRNAWLLRIAPDPSDPWSQIRDDRGTAVAYMLRFAEVPDPRVSEVWRELAEGFDEIHFASGEPDELEIVDE
jgi:hypothetical protein